MRQVLVILFMSFPNIRRLALRFNYEFGYREIMIQAIKYYLRKLKYLSFVMNSSHSRPGDLHIGVLDSILPHLRELIINSVIMSKKSLNHLLQNAPKLKILDITGSYVICADTEPCIEEELDLDTAILAYQKNDPFSRDQIYSKRDRIKSDLKCIFDSFIEKYPDTIINWGCTLHYFEPDYKLLNYIIIN